MSDNLKRAIRERMERTGERYTTARMHILAERGAEPRQPSTPPLKEKP